MKNLRRPLRNLVPNLVLLVIVVVVAVPFGWVILASFRESNVLTGQPLDFSLYGPANYIKVLTGTLPGNLVNSAIACIVASVVSVSVSAVAAYAFSRFTFRGSRVLYWSILVVQVIPAVSMVVPLYKLWAQLHFFNSVVGIGIAYAGLNAAVCMLLLKGFVDDIPRELDESAAIDGCSPFAAFRRVILPLLAPALTSAGIYVLVITSQEFVIASSLLNDPNAFVATVGLRNLATQYVTDYGGIMAGSIITAVPVIIIFAIFQKQFVQTVTGGVKA